MLDRTSRSTTPNSFPSHLCIVCAAESSEEDDWPEDRRAEVQQSPTDTHSNDPHRSEPQPQSKAEISTEQRSDDSCQMPSPALISGGQLPNKSSSSTRPPEFTAAVQAAAASLKDSEGPRGEARTAALLLAHAGNQSSEFDADRSDDEHDQPRPSALPCVHIPAEEQVHRNLSRSSPFLVWPERFSQPRLHRAGVTSGATLCANNHALLLFDSTQRVLMGPPLTTM